MIVAVPVKDGLEEFPTPDNGVKQKLRNNYVKNMGNPGKFTYAVKFK